MRHKCTQACSHWRALEAPPFFFITHARLRSLYITTWLARSTAVNCSTVVARKCNRAGHPPAPPPLLNALRSKVNTCVLIKRLQRACWHDGDVVGLLSTSQQCAYIRLRRGTLSNVDNAVLLKVGVLHVLRKPTMRMLVLVWCILHTITASSASTAP